MAHSDSVSILLQANANPNLHGPDDGVTPLCIAAANGHSDTVSHSLLQMNARGPIFKLMMVSHLSA